MFMESLEIVLSGLAGAAIVFLVGCFIVLAFAICFALVMVWMCGVVIPPAIMFTTIPSRWYFTLPAWLLTLSWGILMMVWGRMFVQWTRGFDEYIIEAVGRLPFI